MRLTLETLHMYAHEEGDCLIWAGGVNNCGYPQARLDGKPTMVRRWIYEQKSGRKLARREPVYAKCGQILCVSPGCLRSTTQGAILRRSYRDGQRSSYLEYAKRLEIARKSGMAKLTPEQVAEIRESDPALTHVAIAVRYGVGEKAVGEIRRGLSWRETGPQSSVFTWRPK